MIDCPKCGFSQPKDQFCANCGINIEQFEPAPKPVSQKVASNTYLIGVLIVVILGSMIWYLNTQKEPSLSSSENIITRDAEFEKQREVERENEIQQRQQRRQQRRQELIAQKAAQQTMSATSANVIAAEEKQEATSLPVPKQLQIRFYEIPRPELDPLFNQSTVFSETRNSRSLNIKDQKILARILTQAKPLGPPKTWNLQPGGTLSENFSNNTSPDKQMTVELGIEIVVNRVSSEIVSFQFRSEFYWEAEGAPPLSTEVPFENHQLASTGASVIAGFLPHDVQVDPESDEVLPGPLSILSSPEFKENTTEFIMVIAPQL